MITAEGAKELVTTHTSTIDRLTALGFTPQQIRELAVQDGVKLNSEETRVAIRTASLFGLDPKEAAQFVAMTVGNGEFQYDGPLTELAQLGSWQHQGKASYDTVFPEGAYTDN